jgi:hypothetical protein
MKNSLFLFILFLNVVYSQNNSTWDIIQSEILDINCTIGCHVQGSSFAEQSNLILTEDVAYAQLVNAFPHNSAAMSDGLLRVGTEGLSSLYTSFMWEKINAPDHEHFYTDHPYYGAIMPLGLPVLTNGELDFIREWIIGGAPEEGEVADTLLFEDTTRYEPPVFEILSPPEQGIQFHLGPFEISSGLDREFFYYHPIEESQDIFIKKVEINMRPGSHHFIGYTFGQNMPEVLYPEPFVFRDLRDEDGNYIQENMVQMAFHQFGVGTQWPHLDYHFPPGVALRMNPNLGFDLNSHYVNYSDTTMIGEVYLNLHTLEPEQVVKEANILMMNNGDINLPPNQVTTLTQTFWIGNMFPEPISIFQLFSHAHQHMLEFKVYVEGGEQDGELIYVANDWAHPPILELEPPLYLELTQGLTLEATYDNWTDETLEFGFLSTDEMMILFGYYYFGESPQVVSLTIQEGWNLVGLPFEIEDTLVESVFPQSSPGTLYSFNGTYTDASVLEFGSGYWLYFDEDESIVLSGNTVETNVVNLTEGWNLISGISSTVSVSGIYDPQNILVPGTVYGFNGTYFSSDVLSPGKGYWINAIQDGSILLSANNTQNRIKQSSQDENLNSISFGKMSLYFGCENSTINTLSYTLPPKPPTGGKDIRFSGDTKLCTTDECLIEVMNSTEVLQITYNIQPFEGLPIKSGEVPPSQGAPVWMLVNEKNHEQFTLSGIGELEITGDISELILRKSTASQTPTEFVLFPAHPNPFNPVTMIQFSVAVGNHNVSLQVYDITGKLVETLVNEKLSSGIHTVKWNGTGFSSGVYFVLLTDGTHQLTKKIVLLK